MVDFTTLCGILVFGAFVTYTINECAKAMMDCYHSNINPY